MAQTALYSTEILKEANAPTFKSLSHILHPSLLDSLDQMNYEYMTPVQHKVLTQLKTVRDDCLVQAKTGTGKTIAFLLPALQNLLVSPSLQKGQVTVLIISPTRELALQIAKECDQLTAAFPRRLECHTAFGGTARDSNLRKFMNGSPSVLVATPGRLKDYLSEPSVKTKFSNVKSLILDEADTMLERGFLLDIKQILKTLPPKTSGWQGMCFSATVPAKIEDVIHTILKPGFTRISTIDNSEPPTVSNVPQFSVIVPNISEIFTTLLAIIKAELTENFKVVVFSSTANGTALLYHLFNNMTGVPRAWQMQSRMSQPARTRATEEFKNTESGILFASDVVGRGMDFPNVGLVIQVGVPTSGEQYVHRVGRTARAGNSGRAVILLTQAEQPFIHFNKGIPIKPYPQNLTASATGLEPVISARMQTLDMDVKKKAYQAWLGFNKDQLHAFKKDREGLVAMAAEFASAMGCSEPPAMDAKVIGKMGLKGVAGLRIEKGVSSSGRSTGQGRGGFGGGRGPPANGGLQSFGSQDNTFGQGRGGGVTRGGGQGRGRGRGGNPISNGEGRGAGKRPASRPMDEADGAHSQQRRRRG